MAEKRAKEIMTNGVITLRSDDSLQYAKDRMAKRGIRHFPVLDGESLVGVVSQRDVLRASLSSVALYGANTERAFLDVVSVKGVMSQPAITVSPDESLKEIARLMIEKKIGCLPVVEGKRLVGLITEIDLMREIAEIQPLKREGDVKQLA